MQCIGNGELISRSAFKLTRRLKNEHGLCNTKSTLGIILPVTSSVNAGVWRRRGGVWQVLKWPSLLAEPSLSLMTIMYSCHPLGEPLPEYSSMSMTNLHQQPGCLQALAPLAGTRDKTHWPGRLLANTPLCPAATERYRLRYELLANRQQTSTFCDSQILDFIAYWQISKQRDQLPEEISANISFEN